MFGEGVGAALGDVAARGVAGDAVMSSLDGTGALAADALRVMRQRDLAVGAFARHAVLRSSRRSAADALA